MTTPQALLVLIFRSARVGRRPNLTAFCERNQLSVSTLQNAFDQLEESGLLAFGPEGERLTLPGLAVAAALSKQKRQQARPLASCRPLAA